MVETIKEKFIEYFGKKKWNQEELLEEVFKYQLDICNLLSIEIIPIVFEDGIEDDSRLYLKERYIVLSDKINTPLEAIKCIAHECKHIEQLIRASAPSTKQEHRWKKCFDNLFNVNDYSNIDELSKYAVQETEIDAYAFTQFYIKERLGINMVYPNKEYQMIIDRYKEKYYE